MRWWTQDDEEMSMVLCSFDRIFCKYAFTKDAGDTMDRICTLVFTSCVMAFLSHFPRCFVQRERGKKRTKQNAFLCAQKCEDNLSTILL
jgi:hypothetical protein